VNQSEVVDVLTAAAMFDRRTVGKADAEAWLAVIGDLPAGEAIAAVRAHYTETTDWLMPAHIRKRVREMRAQRVDDAEIPPPPRELADNPAAYTAALRAAEAAAADGADPRQAMAMVARRAQRELEA
jgi:hypothetical protein